jgi:hypothetical protein
MCLVKQQTSITSVNGRNLIMQTIGGKTLIATLSSLLCISVMTFAQGLIAKPEAKKAAARPKLAPRPAPKPAQPKVLIFEHANYGGEKLAVNDNLSTLPPPLGRTENGGHGQASSLKVNHNGWVVFWEGKNFRESDDQLWVQGPIVISDLSRLNRPHGNHHWGDRILAVSFPGGPPTGSDKNRTIIRKNTRVR